MNKLSMSKQELQGTVSKLGDLNPLYLVFLMMPVLLTSLVLTFVRDFYPPFGSHITYALCNWVTILILYLVLKSKGLHKEVFLFKRMNKKQVIAAFITFLIGIYVVFPATSFLSKVIGLKAMSGMSYQLNNALHTLIVVFYAVITAPIAEEILFRGLGMGYLISRGMCPIVSGVLSILAFSLIHVPYFGVSGALFITFWAVLPSYLRIKYNNITPALTMHVLNNIFAYIIVVMFF